MEMDWKQETFAMTSGVSIQTIRGVRAGRLTNPTLITLKTWAEGLGYELKLERKSKDD